ncbi:MAG TPA: hypothetical protein PKZ53_12600 [Acidobacteriota bacterium]|nr:hypothetical protein [Acidobacteriota bacterium]
MQIGIKAVVGRGQLETKLVKQTTCVLLQTAFLVPPCLLYKFGIT